MGEELEGEGGRGFLGVCVVGWLASCRARIGCVAGMGGGALARGARLLRGWSLDFELVCRVRGAAARKKSLGPMLNGV